MPTPSRTGSRSPTASIRCARSSTSTARTCCRGPTPSSPPPTAPPRRPSTALAASQARTRTGIIAVGIAMVALGLGFSWLIGRSITRPLNGLAAVMKRLADGDTSARIPATHAQRRDRRDGAHGDRVPRQHDRAGKARGHPGRDRPRPGTAQLDDLADHRAVQAFGRERAGQAARGLDEARNELDRPQQGRRHHVGGSADRRAARGRRLRQRDRGGELGRGTGGLDRRDRRAGRRNRPTSPAARCRKRSAPSPPWRSSARPPPASARWWG